MHRQPKSQPTVPSRRSQGRKPPTVAEPAVFAGAGATADGDAHGAPRAPQPRRQREDPAAHQRDAIRAPSSDAEFKQRATRPCQHPRGKRRRQGGGPEEDGLRQGARTGGAAGAGGRGRPPPWPASPAPPRRGGGRLSCCERDRRGGREERIG